MQNIQVVNGRKEGNDLFNDALNIFYFTVILEGRKEMIYLMMHLTHFILVILKGIKNFFYLTMHSTHFVYRQLR